MHTEQGRFIGIGVALVDHVFKEVDKAYPATRDEVLPFIETNKPSLVRAGGPIPNIFTALSYFSTSRKFRLFHAVGNDDRGRFFKQETISQIGPAQTPASEPTGVWAGFIDDKGRLRFGLSYYGAALKVKITKEEVEQESNGIFVTDISSCKDEDVNSQANMILDQLHQDGGIFVLSLGGARFSTDYHRLSSVINSLNYQPQIVFSNLEEFKFTTQTKGVKEAIESSFPNARLVVVTEGERGSLIRFEDQIIRIPAIVANNVVDETGAGDAYAGVMLGQLFNYPYRLWNCSLVKHTGLVASFAAAQVIASPYVRLGAEQGRAVLSYSAEISSS